MFGDPEKSILSHLNDSYFIKLSIYTILINLCNKLEVSKRMFQHTFSIVF